MAKLLCIIKGAVLILGDDIKSLVEFYREEIFMPMKRACEKRAKGAPDD